MALFKKITKPNGLELTYHRIAMVKIDTNEQITILLYSYLNEEGRNYEKDYALGKIEGEPDFPFYAYEYISLPYADGMDIEKAYAYIKSLPEFEGAIDV